MPTRKRNRRRPRKSSERRWPRALVRCTSLFLGLHLLLVLPWRWLPPPTTAFMLRERLGWGVPHPVRVEHHWVPLAQISPQLAIAVVAAEDQKFLDHNGFDFDAIARAAQEHRHRARGASTLSQQLAKNL